MSETRSVESIEAQLEQLEDERDRLVLDRDEYKKLYELVHLELERTRRQLFGRKGEKVDPAQTQLAFAELTQKLETLKEYASDESKPERKRKTKPHGRRPLPESLPVERIVVEPAAEAIEGCKRIGEEVSETLEYRHAGYVRVQIVRPKYVKDTEGDGSKSSWRRRRRNRSPKGSAALRCWPRCWWPSLRTRCL